MLNLVADRILAIATPPGTGAHVRERVRTTLTLDCFAVVTLEKMLAGRHLLGIGAGVVHFALIVSQAPCRCRIKGRGRPGAALHIVRAARHGFP